MNETATAGFAPVMNEIICGDTRKVIQQLPSSSVDLIITSPPYWGLRDYCHPDQVGSEPTPEEYIDNLMGIFSHCYRILSPDGLFFLNIGDTYFGYWGNTKCGDDMPPSSRSDYNENFRPKFKPCGWKKDKQKALIPFRVAISLQEQGWIIRNDIVWNKPNYRPEKVKNRVDCSNEYWFFCVKNARTRMFEKNEILRKDLWVYESSKDDRHYATFPLQMISDLVASTTAAVIFDPFMGSGTTAIAAKKNGRNFLGIELREDYIEKANQRLNSI